MNGLNTKINYNSSYNLQKVILFVTIFLFLTKLITWKITSSLSIFSDAMDSLLNLFSSIIGLCSIYISSIPKDKNHPYGHGKIEFISIALEGILISFIGAGIFINSFIKLKNCLYNNIFSLSKIDCGIFLMSFTAIINYLMGFFACKIGTINKTLTLVASGKHLKTDTYSTFGVIIGLILLNKTGYLWIDPIISLIFSFIILYNGYKLIRIAAAGIMDEFDKNLLSELSNYLNKKKNTRWIDLHHLKIIKYGSFFHIDCHLTVPWFFNIKEANKEVKILNILTKKKFGNRVELFVHIDACSILHCKICAYNPCNYRKRLFKNKYLDNK